MKKTRGVLVVAALCATPAVAAAQTVELGVDVGAQVGTETPRVTLISVPVQRIRAGLYMSEVLSVEPSFGVNHVRIGESDFSATVYELDLGVLWHFSPPQTGTSVYLRPFAGITGASAEGESESEFSAGAGVGVKLPFRDQLQWRLEASLRRLFDAETQVIGVSAGVSFLLGGS